VQRSSKIPTNYGFTLQPDILTSGMDGVSNFLASVVRRTLQQQTPEGMTDTLAEIASFTDSVGCILWEASDKTLTDGAGHLYVLAQWFPSNFCAIHNLPFSSVTGDAIARTTAQNVPDIDFDSRVYKQDTFLSEQGIRSFCSIPLAMPDNRQGALNAYRQRTGGFDAMEISTLSLIAPLLGPMYSALTERVSSNLLQTVARSLKETHATTDAQGWWQRIRSAADDICISVGTAFNSREVSIFLRDDLPIVNLEEPRPKFSLVTSTWKSEMKKTTYVPDPAEGLTGAVLSSKRSFRFMDLAHFKRDEQPKYPGLEWSDSLDVQQLLRQAEEKGIRLRPMSFMAAPIAGSDNLFGVIRCSMAKTEPYYYTDRELKLLEVIATTFAAFLERAQNELVIHDEMGAWKAVIASVGALNHLVYSELSGKTPSEKQIFEEALRITSTVIPGAEIMDIRLYDEKRKRLTFAHTKGMSWKLGSQAEINRRLKKTYKIGTGKIKSAGEYVMRHHEVYHIRDVRSDPYYSETFPNVRQMIIAPIIVHDKIYGVLDIRATSDVFPPYANGVANLVGRQLGLYHYLAETIRQLRDTEAELRRSLKRVHKVQQEQAQAFEDLAHQLKTPGNYAHARAQVELTPKALADFDPKVALRLLAIRGNIGKLRRVILSLRLLIDLARGDEPEPEVVRITRPQLVKMLIEMAVDHQFMSDPDRPVRFQVMRETFDLLDRIIIEGTWDLLEQAVNTLLDNAGKYSFGDTEVRIYGGITTAGRFHISISSEGLTLRGSNTTRAKQRGWRSEEARDVTGEGTGIGLWLVDHIMRAQGGELVVNATTTDGRTDIKLVFPIKRGLADVRHDRGR
jgi:signal transduction histidine kinase